MAKQRATSSGAAPPADAAGVRARVEALLSAGPRKARPLRDALVAEVRATPSLRAALPAPGGVPEVHRRAIVDAHAAALVAERDGVGLCALVASLEGALAWGVVQAVGNARELAPFAPVAAHALERDEPDVRLAGVYFVRRWLAAGGDVGALAAGLVRAAADERRGEAIKGNVSTAARDAVREAAAQPAARAAMEAAVAGDGGVPAGGAGGVPAGGAGGVPAGGAGGVPASTRRAIQKLISDASSGVPGSVAEAVRALEQEVRLQQLGLAYLTSALVKDMIDVRAAFPRVSQLLASDDDDVREAAAALAYYAADLQGPTEEAQALRGPLEQLAADERASRRVREEAEAALRALGRGRQG